jgi:hypothetical protein
MDLLISLGGVLKGAENVWVGATFDAVDKVADFAEEGIIVGERVLRDIALSDMKFGQHQGIRLTSLLHVVSGPSQVQSGSVVRVDQSDQGFSFAIDTCEKTLTSFENHRSTPRVHTNRRFLAGQQRGQRSQRRRLCTSMWR